MQSGLNNKHRHLLISLLTMALLFFIYQLPRTSQDPSYHNFSDQQVLFGIDNFFNVASNIPFLILGLSGLYCIYLKRSLKLLNEIQHQYGIFFISLCLLSFASGIYHLSPNNNGLYFDRAVMSLSFLSLFCIIIAEHISIKLSRYLFIPLNIIGISCVSYWYYTELNDAGDLRSYIAVQFIPLILTLVILLTYSSRFNRKDGYGWMLILYIFAKLSEHFDAEIFNLSNQWMSGHTLKHLLAAMAVLMLLRLFYQRQRKHD